MKYKMIIVMREDIKLSCGKTAAQASHAAVCCAFEAKKAHAKWFKKWRSEGGKKVVVKVDDLNDLLSLEKKAKSQKLSTCLIIDAGLTEVPPNTITCLGIGPAPNELIDPITAKLPLFR
ncbi:MAG: peptidyl-tRNA hydrolase Pth2 [Thermoplasmata archaeon]